MADIVVVVPLTPDQTMTLLLQAAEALQHQVVQFDAVTRRSEIHVDFDFRAFATFRVHAQASAHSATETELRLQTRAGSRLMPWTGFRQSHRVGWRIVGKMQEILDPERYRALEDDVVPSRTARARADREAMEADGR
jgi:hypothetical protein